MAAFFFVVILFVEVGLVYNPIDYFTLLNHYLFRCENPSTRSSGRSAEVEKRNPFDAQLVEREESSRTK